MTTPIFRKYAILLGLLSCAGASHGSESLLPESTSGDSIRLHELFVNGRRMYDHKLPIPQYLKTIDADRIDLMNPQTTADMLAGALSVGTEEPAGRGQPVNTRFREFARTTGGRWCENEQSHLSRRPSSERHNDRPFDSQTGRGSVWPCISRLWL